MQTSIAAGRLSSYQSVVVAATLDALLENATCRKLLTCSSRKLRMMNAVVWIFLITNQNCSKHRLCSPERASCLRYPWPVTRSRLLMRKQDDGPAPELCQHFMPSLISAGCLCTSFDTPVCIAALSQHEYQHHAYTVFGNTSLMAHILLLSELQNLIMRQKVVLV